MSKSLIIYFSRADENYFGGSMRFIEKGNTEVIAEYIKEFTNGDLFKVEPKIPYSKEYSKCLEEAKRRTNIHDAPIVNNITDISLYDTVYIGVPVYWGGMPEEMFTALSGLNFNGKIIKPFVTHEGSGLASIPNEIKIVCKGATLRNGLAIIGSNVYAAKEIVKNWINE